MYRRSFLFALVPVIVSMLVRIRSMWSEPLQQNVETHSKHRDYCFQEIDGADRHWFSNWSRLKPGMQVLAVYVPNIIDGPRIVVEEWTIGPRGWVNDSQGSDYCDIAACRKILAYPKL